MTPQEMKTLIDSGYYDKDIVLFNIDLEETFNVEYNEKAEETVGLAYYEVGTSKSTTLTKVFDRFTELVSLLDASFKYEVLSDSTLDIITISELEAPLTVATRARFDGDITVDLNINCDYFLRQETGSQYGIFATIADANANTNKIVLTEDNTFAVEVFEG